MTGFLGQLGTQDWVDDQDPQSWREMILRLDPNGDAPLTAMTALLSSEVLENTTFNWWTKAFQDQRGVITGRYINADLSTSYTNGGSIGTMIYFKMAEADAQKFRPGHQVMARYTLDSNMDVVAEVIGVAKNGANSYISVRLQEADDNSANSDLSDADVLWVIGNVNEEGAARPQALTKLPTKIYNQTQIVRTSCEITGTAKVVRLRTGNSYEEQKLDAMFYHGAELEKMSIFSVLSTRTGDGGKEVRSTDGIRAKMRAHAPNNFFNFQTSTDSKYQGKTWLAKGGAWLNEIWEQQFRFGEDERVCLCGSGALLGINEYVESKGTFNFTAETAAYGIKVVRWTTAFGDVLFKRHPLFCAEPTLRNSMLILEPKDMIFRPMKERDTHFRPDPDYKKSGQTGVDGIAEEWLTEGGFEYHFPEVMGWADGIGLDNNA